MGFLQTATSDKPVSELEFYHADAKENAYAAWNRRAALSASQQATQEEDAFVIDRMSKILAGIAIALKGPELPRHRHGYHDLAEVAQVLVIERDLLKHQNAELRLALQAVVAIADRETEPFIRARSLLASYTPTASTSVKSQQAEAHKPIAELRRLVENVIENSDQTGEEDWYSAKSLQEYSDGIISKPDAEFIAAMTPVVAYGLLNAATPAVRDWREDADHENGKYQCQCAGCGDTFIGHKRRVMCKVCAATPAARVPEGFVLVPDADNMTDEQAEAIAKAANCCCGIAYDIYRAALDAAPNQDRETDETKE